MQSGYKLSRMQNGLTTLRGGMLYVSSMTQIETDRRCRTEHKRAAGIKKSYSYVNDNKILY